ncbi:MAG: hypothetical protein U9M98_00575 [Patescibacteria group bacterium]|nr:hypothetical protein [Patescibacteria group bacterium]
MTEIKASTQEHLDIEEITNNLVVLKNGNAVAVLQTTAVNFDLLSEREQDSIIEAYGALLNSLSFPLQIIVRSKRLNINSYINKLSKLRNGQKTPGLKEQMDNYLAFIKNLTQKNEVLDKKCYVSVPFRNIKLTVETPIQKLIRKLQGKPAEPQIDVDRIIQKATPKLEPRIDQLEKQFNRIGIKVQRLNTEQLTKLFYEMYNS